MKQKTLSVLFFVRKTRLLKNGEAPLFMRLTVAGASSETTIQRSVAPELWCQISERTKGKDRLSVELNNYLDTIKAKILQHFREMELDGVAITNKSLLNRFHGRDNNLKMLCEVFEEHNTQIAKLSQTEISPVTVKRYEKSLAVLRDFLRSQRNVEDFAMKEIDPKFVSDYEIYLKVDCRCSHNTVVKRLKNLKKIIRIAQINGWISRDPFVHTKLKEQCAEREFLTTEELNVMISKVITIPRLEQVRDVYIFCAMSGLSFSDVQQLTHEHIVKDTNGDMWIRKARQKTKNMCNIPLLDVPLALIEKYKNNEYCVSKGVLLPVVSNQRMNGYLKELADICGINKRITAHTARHSFAILSISNGISMESISKMLGHTNIRTTQHYARILDTKINSEMNKLRGKFKIASNG